MDLGVAGWNGPAWSIGAEFYTYILFALVLLLAQRRLVAVSVALSVAGLGFIFWRAPDLMNATFDYGMVRCIAGFFAGVVAYHCYERLSRRSARNATMLEVSAFLLVVVFVACAGRGPDAVGVASMAAPLVFGTAVIVFAGERGLISLVLRAPPFRALGRYSFSIYLIHLPLLTMLCYGLWLAGHSSKIFPLAGAQTSPGSGNLLLVDFVLAVVLLSAATYRFVELPARERIYAAAGARPRRRAAVEVRA
jgi:peptidoglycan/LPS O-acetylase OafA/YrhL